MFQAIYLFTKVAFIYNDGKYINRDRNKMFFYLKLAADKNNDAISMCSLGIFYVEGISIERDIKKGIHYLELSAKQKKC